MVPCPRLKRFRAGKHYKRRYSRLCEKRSFTLTVGHKRLSRTSGAIWHRRPSFSPPLLSPLASCSGVHDNSSLLTLSLSPRVSEAARLFGSSGGTRMMGKHFNETLSLLILSNGALLGRSHFSIASCYVRSRTHTAGPDRSENTHFRSFPTPRPRISIRCRSLDLPSK